MIRVHTENEEDSPVETVDSEALTPATVQSHWPSRAGRSNITPMASIREMAMLRFNGLRGQDETDFLATEEPLEIRVEGKSIAVVMRTPGEDRELAAGFLVTEGLVRAAEDVLEIATEPHCPLPLSKNQNDSSSDLVERAGNIVNVRLKDPDSADLKKLTRHVFTSSSCGICSKATIQAVRQQFPPIDDLCEVDPAVLLKLPASLSAAQRTFQRTGGLHAAALFDLSGRLVVLREDVGRHNALDKVIGWALLEGRLPLRQHVLLLSGRTSFEMLQKALAAGVPIVAAISAPSSLAAQFAHDCGQTLIGFLRGDKMNLYAGTKRVRCSNDCPVSSNGITPLH